MSGSSRKKIASNGGKLVAPDRRQRRRVLLSSTIRAHCQVLAAEPGQAVITSPYMTSNTADTVIAKADPLTTIVLTTFNAETFATGGSSLKTLRKLAERGFKLLAHDRLHAKIVVAGDDVFVGSQNLTRAGNKNREATVHLPADTEAANQVREEVARWVSEAREVTLDMISDLEEALRPLAELASELRRQALELDGEIVRKEERRQAALRAQAEADRQREMERRRRERLAAARRASAALQEAVRATPTARKAIPLVLREIPLAYQDQYEMKTYWTLKAPSKTDFSQLGFGDDETELRLTPRMRYLLIVPEIGRLGWPALNRTRFTRFGADLNRNDLVIDVAGLACNASIWLNADLDTLELWNVRFIIHPKTSTQGVDIKARFSLDGFSFSDLTADPSGAVDRDLVEQLLEDPNSALINSLRAALMKPFQYESNRSGSLASEFCAGLGDRFIVRWHRYDDFPFFTMDRYGGGVGGP